MWVQNDSNHYDIRRAGDKGSLFLTLKLWAIVLAALMMFSLLAVSHDFVSAKVDARVFSEDHNSSSERNEQQWMGSTEKQLWKPVNPERV